MIFYKQRVTVIHNPTEGWVIVENSPYAAAIQVASVMQVILPDSSFNTVRWLTEITEKYNLTVTFY